VRARVRDLLRALEGKTARERALRQSRGVEVLEHIGGREARQVLQGLAGGADAPLTREAKAALQRLARGVNPP
jgi:HEAT repeat protein